MLWNASGRNVMTTRLDVLIENARQMRIELQEMTAKVEELREQMERERHSP